ncbi:uncharacterized protein BDR25DRAFT_304759, partial [Lindgomyces ingoldianus]
PHPPHYTPPHADPLFAIPRTPFARIPPMCRCTCKSILPTISQVKAQLQPSGVTRTNPSIANLRMFS